jgi:predicted enzyme related to lactoylglutathione lyase
MLAIDLCGGTLMATRTKRKSKATKKAKARPARKAARPASRKARPSSEMKHEPTQGLYGWITHTDLASNNPPATKEWAKRVLGWTFRPPMKTPNGDIFLFAYSDQGGGAIRANNPPEIPGSIPYIHVADCQASYKKALAEGAEEMMSPTRVMEGVTIAIVRAPGGVPVGLSGP